ncbi:imelysin family protein [Virgifigura deserti]|uniref:imelysin family protein n=1 Tax=Virgifigura deserti TaxID=2268457 RepID=UPI003CCC43C2
MAAATGAFAVSVTLAQAAPDKRAIIETYADIAQAKYEDSLIRAKALQQAVDALIAEPTEQSLQAAREAWLAARVPYQQTEVYRFGNAIVDDWEGKVNAWPLDEGLIDYVDASYGSESDQNQLYTANVVANEAVKFGGEVIDTSEITKALLADTLQEVGGVEANVATGYHAIEFLLWGQDLNGTGPGAGARSASDFDPANCTGGSCERRAEYLAVATDLLIDDLTWMAEQWASGGAARDELLSGDPDAGLTTILTGMGSLSYGELAGERMQLGLMLHDPEEEHDCFSDNTHYSHYYDAVGIQNVYLGEYERIDGSEVSGPSLSDFVAETAPDVDAEIKAKLEATLAAMEAIVERAEGGEAYDQMIGPDNPKGNAVVQAAIDALTNQTKSIERVVATLELQPIAFEGSDSLDNPAAVFE